MFNFLIAEEDINMGNVIIKRYINQIHQRITTINPSNRYFLQGWKIILQKEEKKNKISGGSVSSRVIERIDSHRAIPRYQTERRLLITGNYAPLIYQRKMGDESCFESGTNGGWEGKRRKKKSELRKRKREEGKKTAEMEGRKAPGVYTEGLAKKSIESWNRRKTRGALTCSNWFANNSILLQPFSADKRILEKGHEPVETGRQNLIGLFAYRGPFGSLCTRCF